MNFTHHSDLAVSLSSLVHQQCKDVPHDIGLRLMEIVEPYVDAEYKRGYERNFNHLISIEEIDRLKEKKLIVRLIERFSLILLGEKICLDITWRENPQINEYSILVPAYRRFTKTHIKKMAKNYKTLDADPSPIRNKIRQVIAEEKSLLGLE